MTRLRALVAAAVLAATAAAAATDTDRGEPVRFLAVDYAGDDGQPAPPAGHFRNPVLPGFYPDPSAVRVGDDFWLVTSTFGYFPGLPVFHSRDLVNWTQVGNAIDRAGQLDYGEREELTRGLFAASISHHDGVFYIANTCFYCDRGNFLVTATDPAGPWSDPIWLGFSGIDPSLFFDDDGRAWMVNNDVPDGPLRYDGHRAIWLQEYDVAAKKMVGPRTVLVDGGVDPASKPEHVEGPHLFRHDGWVYLTAAEGGTGDQHAQMIWRSRTVTGPYEPWTGNPTLTQRDLDPARPRPVIATGHAQFLQLADGSWWTVFLATRPYRGSQENLGRETFLLPVQWKDGWPQVLARGENIPGSIPLPPGGVGNSGTMRWEQRFAGAALPLDWMTLHPPQSAWFTTGADGLRLWPKTTALGEFGKTDGQPAFVAHRLQHARAEMTATLAAAPSEAGTLAGLALIQNERHHVVVGVARAEDGASVVLRMRDGDGDPPAGRCLASVPLADADAATTIRLRLQIDGPALAAAWATAEGDWQALGGALDASRLSVAVAGGFTGNTFGPYALRAATTAAGEGGTGCRGVAGQP